MNTVHFVDRSSLLTVAMVEIHIGAKINQTMRLRPVATPHCFFVFFL